MRGWIYVASFMVIHMQLISLSISISGPAATPSPPEANNTLWIFYFKKIVEASFYYYYYNYWQNKNSKGDVPLRSCCYYSQYIFHPCIYTPSYSISLLLLLLLLISIARSSPSYSWILNYLKCWRGISPYQDPHTRKYHPDDLSLFPDHLHELLFHPSINICYIYFLSIEINKYDHILNSLQAAN